MTAASRLVIEARGPGMALRLDELWRYREVLVFLAWRDLKVRYKQTVIGVIWVIGQPLLLTVTLAVFFGHFAGIPSNGIPYPLFVFGALLPWSLFASGVTQSGQSLLNNPALVTKVYVPRLLIPMAPILVGLVDFAVGFAVLALLMVIYGVIPGVGLVVLPLFVLMTVLTAFSVGVWLAALTADYRDLRHALPFLMQVWLLATPVVYPSSLVPPRWRLVFGLNPMTGVVEGVRWALFGGQAFPAGLLAVSLTVMTVLLVTGLTYFKRRERGFADVL